MVFGNALHDIPAFTPMTFEVPNGIWIKADSNNRALGIVMQFSFSNSIKARHVGLRPANERRRYKVTPSLIGGAQA